VIEVKIDNTNKKKKEYSKIVLGSIIILTYMLVIFTCVMVAITLDLGILKVLIPSLFSLTTISVGFYSWKAKTENKYKLEIARIEKEEELKKKYKNKDIKIDLSVPEDTTSNTNNYDYVDYGDGIG